MPNPATHFDHLRKSGLFGAPAAAVSVISNEAPADRKNISTYLRANEVLANSPPAGLLVWISRSSQFGESSSRLQAIAESAHSVRLIHCRPPAES